MPRFRVETLALMLLAQMNGLPFTKSFSPERFSPHLLGYSVESEASNHISDAETKKITGLKEKLKADFDAGTIDSLFADPSFKLERNIPDKFGIKPKNDVDSKRKHLGWHSLLLFLKENYAPSLKANYNSHLEKAEQMYGVDGRIIVGILTIESAIVGEYKAFNALVSQYVLITKRQGFAYRELKNLILYSQKTGKPIFDLNSSYAGAIGCAQFIPSSLNQFFIGENGRVESADPNNIVDCIYSVANYLQKKGWNMQKNGQKPTKGSTNWRAIYAYNQSNAYVTAVVGIAQSLK